MINGWIKDIPSDKDYSFNKLKPTLLGLSRNNIMSEYIIKNNVNVFDQLQMESCVANATVGALQILKSLENKSITLSRLFVYWNARLYTKDTDKNVGTYIRNAFDSLSTLGVCQETTWKYDMQNIFAQPPLNAYKEGDDNKIESYYRIDSLDTKRADDVESAIRANHPVVFGTGVSLEFERYKGGDKVWTKSDIKSVAGGHAMCIIGVRYNNGTREFYVRNSWDRFWGDNGHFWMSEDYLNWSETDDLWVPTLIADLVV